MVWYFLYWWKWWKLCKDEDCEFVNGCTDNGNNLNQAGEVNDLNGDGLPAFNYNDQAVIDDGSCEQL